MAFETFCELFYKFLDESFRFFIIEPTFCERDKNHKFDNFKTCFILSDYYTVLKVSVSLCIQSECRKTLIRITPNMDNFYAALCYKRC